MNDLAKIQWKLALTFMYFVLMSLMSLALKKKSLSNTEHQ